MKLSGGTSVRCLWIGLLSVVMSVVLSGIAAAVSITVPTGLNPGDQYRLAFLTSTTRPATSTSIADYNVFVTTAANAVPALAALGTTWSAIGSTSVVDARDNTGTNPSADGVGVPIYQLDDTLLAGGNADLWDSSIAVPFVVHEDGSDGSAFPFVWTGTDSVGVASPLPLGSTTGGTLMGDVGLTDFQWISTVHSASTTSRPLYAMSDTLTVVPEPGSGVLLSLGLVAMAVGNRRRPSTNFRPCSSDVAT
jgi:hypothetical protein